MPPPRVEGVLSSLHEPGPIAAHDLLGARVREVSAGAPVEGAAPNRERSVWTARVGRIKARHEVTTGRIRQLNANATSADARVRSRPAEWASTTLKRSCAGAFERRVAWSGVCRTCIRRLGIGRRSFRHRERAAAIVPDPAVAHAFAFRAVGAGADARGRASAAAALVRRALRTGVGCAIAAAACRNGQRAPGQDHLTQTSPPVHTQEYEASVVPARFVGIPASRLTDAAAHNGPPAHGCSNGSALPRARLSTCVHDFE
jgi:hypothetical protein